MVHLLATTAPEGTAQTRIVALLGRDLDPRRYRLEAWVLGKAGPLEDELRRAGVVSRRLPFAGGRDVAGALRFAWALARARPAVIHLHVGGRSRTWIARCLSRAKLVAHLHATHDDDGRPLNIRAFAGAADVVVATSRAVAEQAAARTVVVHPGVDLPTTQASPEDRLVVGSAGRLEPVKRLDVLLSAVAQLRSRFPELRLLIAGEGTSRAGLERRARELSLDAQLTGWVEDPTSFHRRLGVFCVPSGHEGFGLAALEAMASGLPVVASRIEGLCELVEDGRSGFLVPVGDVVGFADRIGRLLADADLRARMGQAGRRLVEERFTPRRMVDGLEAVYRELLR